MIDYAYPTMMAERALKDLHEAFLNQDLELADQKAIEAGRWLLEVRWALKVKREEDASVKV